MANNLGLIKGMKLRCVFRISKILQVVDLNLEVYVNCRLNCSCNFVLTCFIYIYISICS